MNRALAILCAATAMVAAPCPAQLMGATQLKVGVPVKGERSTKPVADVYYIVGESGARETYALTTKGPASLTLFGPDGSEILTASGAGTIKLEAVLPLVNVFTLAVARKALNQPYTLTRKTTVPTFEESFIAFKTGYTSGSTSSCWLIPGVKQRRIFAKGTEELTLAADRKSLSFVSRGPKGTRTGDVSLTYDGATVQQSAVFHDGSKRDVGFKFDPTVSLSETSKFVGYLCKD